MPRVPSAAGPDATRHPRAAIGLLLLPALLAGADTHPADAPVAEAGWITALPAVAEVTSVQGGATWHAGSDTVTITGVDRTRDEALLTTALGTMRLPLHWIADRHVELLQALPALVAQAEHAHLAGTSFTLQVGIVTGPALHAPGITVLPDAVLRDDPVPAGDRPSDLRRLASAEEAVCAALSSTGLDAIGQHALAEVIHHLDAVASPEHAGDLDPRLARLLVRHGYLRSYFRSPAGQKAVAAVEAALDQAMTQRPVAIARSADRRMEDRVDAFGVHLWQLTAAHGTSYAYREPSPSWMPCPPLYVVVDVAPGAAADHADGLPIAARIYDGLENRLASWSREGGFDADSDRWRHVVPRHEGYLEPNTLPPHILLCRPDGDAIGLVAGRGLVPALHDSSHAAVDAFLAHAAQQLSTPASLDLLGEYLFSYTYPSPDAAHPQLLGTRELNSNVQRTVWQSCGMAVGGIIHGHCADIAEIYEDITRRQHHNPIVIGLPAHAACAWAEKEDGAWDVHLLQTGPPMAFHDAQLPDALRTMYTAFDPALPFTPDAVSLLLRFSDDIARSPYTLSWRIFAEPDYCRTMVDVQRDLHEHTYLHGITTMEALMASGDTDPANYTELCGLATHCGKYDLAIAYSARARQRTTSAAGHLLISGRMLRLMLAAGQRDKAEQMAEDVIKDELPDAREAMGAGSITAELTLAQDCLQDDGPSLSSTVLELIGDDFNEPMAQLLDKLTDALGAAGSDGSLPLHRPDVNAALSLVGGYVAVGTRLLHLLPSQDRQMPTAAALAANIESYYNDLAFHQVEDRGDVMRWYAALGAWRAMEDGSFTQRLDACAPATDAHVDHQQRTPGHALQERDLRWIRASVPYWHRCMVEEFGRDRMHLDQAKVAHLQQRLEEAVAATRALGLDDPRMRQDHFIARELAALAAQDEAALRQVLQEIAATNDKAIRDDAAAMLGLSAHLLDRDWFHRAMLAWQQAMNDKSNFFRIAWLAAQAHAPQQALDVAAMAGERYPDEPVFAQEQGYMREALASHDPTSSTDPGHRAAAGVTP